MIDIQHNNNLRGLWKWLGDVSEDLGETQPRLTITPDKHIVLRSLEHGVYVSIGLVELLRPGELRAMVLHEAAHIWRHHHRSLILGRLGALTGTLAGTVALWWSWWWVGLPLLVMVLYGRLVMWCEAEANRVVYGQGYGTEFDNAIYALESGVTLYESEGEVTGCA